VGGTCCTHGVGERCLQGFGWEATIRMDLRDTDRWGELDSGGSA